MRPGARAPSSAETDSGLTSAASRNGPPPIPERPALDHLDHGATRGPDGGAAGGVEAGLLDPVRFDPHGDADLVATCGPARGPGVRVVAQPPAAARGAQVVVERRKVEHALRLVKASAPA